MTGNTAAVEQHVGAGTDLESKEDNGGGTPLILAAIFWEKGVRNRCLTPVQISLETQLRRNRSSSGVLLLSSQDCGVTAEFGV